MAEGVSLGDPNLESKLSKSDDMEKIDFEASVHRGIQSIFKKGEDFVIWGPASVEIVDKEGDKISVEALGKALPQLLRRARLSLEHTDQIVGRILERFETEEPVEIEINGEIYERQDFPTDVLDLDDGEPPALYVAGEVYDDTQQSKRARERIRDGELTSYSISGEALVTRKKVEDGVVFDNILDLDLSAVTLCEEGMNQGANYAKVEGELSGKDLAGESSEEKEDVSKQETPVLEHPTVSGVGSNGVGSSDQQPATTAKSMSNDNNGDTSNGKSQDGASVEDVLKRLPDEGELATKEDLDDVQKQAVEVVEGTLPDGNIATVQTMKEMVESEVDRQVEQATKSEEDLTLDELFERADSPEEFLQLKQEYGPSDADVDAPGHDGNYGSDGGGDSPANSETEEAGSVNQGGDSDPGAAASEAGNTTGGSSAPNQGNETQDYSGVDTTGSKADQAVQAVTAAMAKGSVQISDYLEMSEDDAIELAAQRLDLSADDIRAAIGSGKEEGDYEDGEGDEDEEDEGGGMPPEFEDDEEDKQDDEEEEMPPEDPEDDEDPHDDMMAVLEESLPTDVFEVVREYVGDDKIAREDAQKIAAAVKSDDDSDELSDTVEDVLKGGAEVQGGTAIPTDPNDDQVDKQYSEQETSGGEAETAESPALSNFYN